MRIAILAESFLPEINGVTTSVLRVTAGLAARRHDVLVVAPGHGPVRHAGAQVVRVRALRLPAYRSVPVALPTRQVEACLEGFRPDVVHLAGPLVLGAQGAAVAARLQIPVVAVYQTDWPGFARHYGLAGAQRSRGHGSNAFTVGRTAPWRPRGRPFGHCGGGASLGCTAGAGASTLSSSIHATATTGCAVALPRAAR
ncbi:hypothetical protein BH20ACT8_BH20ACT8_12050 [soil metagenome]